MTLGEKLLELIETLPAAVSHVFGVMPEDILLAVAELRQRANIPSTFNQSIVKAYPSASGSTKCCSRGGGFGIEQITNICASGGRDDRLSPLPDRVPTALRR